jgi:hypothetical protein
MEDVSNSDHLLFLFTSDCRPELVPIGLRQDRGSNEVRTAAVRLGERGFEDHKLRCGCGPDISKTADRNMYKQCKYAKI